MESPKVSIIIPAYNNAEFVGDAIQSVLDQTYPNFELIIVNDASPDNVADVIQQFKDSRIKYIVHQKNLGLSAARNTGIRNSIGDYIALLDGDDYFHPEKLRAHVDYLENHPEIGVTYNARFELNHSSKTIRDLWRPPLAVGLVDLVFGFPFSPSDMVVRREWMFQVDMFNEYHVYVGEDLDINCRLALAGCKFASVDRALNYRRYHSGRVIKNLRGSVDDTIRPLNLVFADPRCPKEVIILKDKVLSNHYLLWSVIAISQDDTALGQEYCLEAIRRNPSYLDGNPSQLITTLISYSIVDDSVDHAQLLRRMIEQLPTEIAISKEQYEWSVARGYLLKGTRAIMWDRFDEGRKNFEEAAELHADIDRPFLRQLTAQLLDYENEFGFEAAQSVIRNLSPHLEKIGDKSGVRWLKGHYLINQAFQNYQEGKFSRVPKEVIGAFIYDPKYLSNRGVLSILFHSISGMRASTSG